MSEEVSGAAQGAVTGMMVGGPVGAVIGGILGLFGGKKAKKARKYAEKAAAVERQQAQMAAGVQRRDMIRQARIARAQAVAAAASESGGLQSSSPMGAVSSMGTQLTSNLGYFDWQVGLGNQAQTYKQKSGKYARQASTFNSLIQVGAMVGGAAASSIGNSIAAKGAQGLQSSWTSWEAANPQFSGYGG